MEPNRNEQLWKIAQKRAGFKIHLRTYLIVNTGLWLLFLVMYMQQWGHNLHPWPIWPMLGWGIGLATHYFSVYRSGDERSLTEREYQKLVRNGQ